jgi:hypothetical protein
LIMHHLALLTHYPQHLDGLTDTKLTQIKSLLPLASQTRSVLYSTHILRRVPSPVLP